MVRDAAARLTVEANDREVVVHAVADGQYVVLQLGLDDALSLADELTIAAHRTVVRAA